MFLLPFGGKMRRSAGKAGRFAGLMLLLMVATCGHTGPQACGSGGSTGYFGQQVKNYTVTVTRGFRALCRTPPPSPSPWSKGREPKNANYVFRIALLAGIVALGGTIARAQDKTPSPSQSQGTSTVPGSYLLHRTGTGDAQPAPAASGCRAQAWTAPSPSSRLRLRCQSDGIAYFSYCPQD